MGGSSGIVVVSLPPYEWSRGEGRGGATSASLRDHSEGGDDQLWPSGRWDWDRTEPLE